MADMTRRNSWPPLPLAEVQRIVFHTQAGNESAVQPMSPFSGGCVRTRPQAACQELLVRDASSGSAALAHFQWRPDSYLGDLQAALGVEIFPSRPHFSDEFLQPSIATTRLMTSPFRFHSDELLAALGQPSRRNPFRINLSKSPCLRARALA